ncbi:MAG: hypothetical protein ABI091_07445 [Ferruginibacter sp.]
MNFSLFRWIKIVLISLLIVATLGVVLRYKILFSLPIVNQKNLLHGHSHFAFAGWVTQCLMVLLVRYLVHKNGQSIYKKYRWVLNANLFTAYGMLIAFPIEGYGLYSIIISTLSVFVSYVFAWMYWKDINKIKEASPAHGWFKVAVLLNAFSSIGAFSLAFMMVAKVTKPEWYLAAEYFYLHFQYNGWFFFGCMGLFTAFLTRFNIPSIPLKKIFLLFALAIVPAYFLSTLWMPLPMWVYILVVISAVAQVVAWIWLLKILQQNKLLLKNAFSKRAKNILMLPALALTAKLLLQLGSTVPSLSQLAFGFRPIVIGYLHLVLLGVISLFLLGYMITENFIQENRTLKIGIVIFACGVILNEVILMTQGITALDYYNIPYINEMLLGAALVLFTGALFMALSKKGSGE